MTILRCAAGLMLLATLAPRAAGQCVDWTAGYHREGITGVVISSAVFDDGSGNGAELYFGGTFSAAGDLPAKNIAKWNGTRWALVGEGRPSSVNVLLVWDDGSGPALYAGCEGFASAPPGGTLANLAKWNGSTWTELPGEAAMERVRALFPHDDGNGEQLYVGATFNNIGGAVSAFQLIARFDGASWSTVGTGLIDDGSFPVVALEVHDDGSGPQLYAGGRTLRSTPGGPYGPVWRWDGAAWHSAFAGFYNAGFALTLEVVRSSTGVESLFAGGLSTLTSSTQKLMLLNGGTWVGVGPNTLSLMRTLMAVPQPGADDLLYAAGGMHLMSGITAGGIGIWSNWQWSTPSALVKDVLTIVLYDEGSGPKLFAGTQGTNQVNEVARGVGRLDGTAWVTPGSAGAGEPGEIERLRAVDDGTGAKLYVCGLIVAGTGTLHNRVARLQGHTWSALGTPFWGRVFNVAAFDDGIHGRQLYACGAFTANNSVGMNRVARWDGTNWYGLAGGLGHVVGGGNIFELFVHDFGSGEVLVALGDFNLANGVWSPYIAAWDGTQWSTPAGGFDNQTRSAVMFDDGSSPALYVGGYFLHAGGVPARYVARWNGSSWSGLGAGPAQPVYDLIVHDDGNGPKLYARSSVGSVQLQRWDGTTWQALPGGPTTAGAVASFDDGTGAGPRLFVGGAFGTQYGAAFDGTSWSPMGTGLTGAVGTFAVFDDGQGPALFAGGQFTRAGAYGSVNIARYGPTGACTPITGTVFCAGDGTGTACPCGNVGATRHGCASSTNAAGAALIAEGQAHLSSDTVTLRASGMGASASLLFFQGTGQAGGGLGVAFGDGLRCVNGTVVRLAVRQTSAGAASFGHAVASDPHVSSAGHLGAMWTTRNYQVWYRDAQTFCTSALYNLTNGVEIRWAP